MKERELGERAVKNEIILINSPSFLAYPPPATQRPQSHPRWEHTHTIFIFCVWQIKRVP